MKRSLLVPAVAASLALLPAAPAVAAAPVTAPVAPVHTQATCPAEVSLPNGFAPEGIASGPGTRFFVGSLANGAIYRGDLRTGKGKVFVAGEQGRVAVGLEYERAADRLWVAGGPTGAVTVYDASSGRRLARYKIESGFLNDIVVTRDAAYVTDSNTAQLVVIPFGNGRALPSQKQVRRVPLKGDLRYVSQQFNANGIVASRDGRSVIVVQSVTGQLFKVNPRTGSTAKIALTGDPLVNGDGMLRRGDTLYVVRNRDNLIAVVDLSGDERRARVTGRLTSPRFKVPSTATFAGGALYAVNARFGTPVEPSTTYTVVRVPLRGGSGVCSGSGSATAPRGGVEAGGAPVSGTSPMALSGLGLGALAGAAGLGMAARRRRAGAQGSVRG